jgi:flagellar hook assembly protein FlgD
VIDDFSVETYTPNSVGVSGGEREAVARLAQNQPNPFRAADAVTTISFRLSNPADAQLRIYDASGRMVRTLVNGPLTSGAHNLAWDGSDDQGRELNSGVYFYRLKAGAFEQSRRMTLLR